MTEIRDADIAVEATAADYDSNKPLSEIEADIARTRSELGETLDALERKLAPRQLLEKGVDMLRGSMDGRLDDVGSALNEVGATLRANPIPVALIGAGIGWLLMSRTGGIDMINSAAASVGQSVRGKLAEAGDRAVDLADHVRHAATTAVSSSADAALEYARPKIDQTVERTTRYATDTAARVGDVAGTYAQQAGAYAEKAGQQLHTARNQVNRAMNDHPLAVGIISLAAGAALALLLPSSRVENRYLGKTRDRLLDEARDLGSEALARAEQIAGVAADAATDAIKREVAGKPQRR